MRGRDPEREALDHEAAPVVQHRERNRPQRAVRNDDQRGRASVSSSMCFEGRDESSYRASCAGRRYASPESPGPRSRCRSDRLTALVMFRAIDATGTV